MTKHLEQGSFTLMELLLYLMVAMGLTWLDQGMGRHAAAFVNVNAYRKPWGPYAWQYHHSTHTLNHQNSAGFLIKQ